MVAVEAVVVEEGVEEAVAMAAVEVEDTVVVVVEVDTAVEEEDMAVEEVVEVATGAVAVVIDGNPSTLTVVYALPSSSLLDSVSSAVLCRHSARSVLLELYAVLFPRIHFTFTPVFIR
jgi:hypothetical protein